MHLVSVPRQKLCCAMLCRDTPPVYPSPDPDDRVCPILDRIIPENAEVCMPAVRPDTHWAVHRFLL